MKKLGFLVISSALLLAGCLGGGGSSSSSSSGGSDAITSVDTSTIATKSIDELAFFAADGTDITDEGTIAILDGQTVSYATKTTLGQQLLPGKSYQIKFTADGKDFFSQFKVGDKNADNKGSVVISAVKNNSGGLNKVDGIIGLISGKVFELTADGTVGEPVSGATISLSAGEATNGAYATAVTDINGAYKLIVNVAKSKMAALLETKLTVKKQGYKGYALSGLQVINGMNTSGFNIIMVSETLSVDDSAVEGEYVESGSVLFEENFEQTSSTLSGWTVEQVYGTNEDNTWHIHTSGLNIQNQSIETLSGSTQLAPNDNSGGYVPNPANGSQAYWYGNPTAGGVTEGNFLGTETGETNAADLISPLIDLSNHSGEVALTFNTWWEIEAVNPNSSGFDIMEVAYQLDGSAEWVPVARLNPLSDPAYDGSKSYLPFSNTGFNSAPTWLQQEPIPLSNLAGEKFKVKFSFHTNDGLYNYFRGWLIDDVQLIAEQGTFPTLDSNTGDYQDYDPGAYAYLAYDDITYEPAITPAPYSSTSGYANSLDAGVTETFTATVKYWGVESSGLKASLIFKDMNANAVSAKFATTDVPSTYYSEAELDITGSVSVPSTDSGWLDLWLQVHDADGALVFEVPLIGYPVN